ncbi:hypothetical protein NPIL_148181 [Nephila pilipes]|uniref:Uncharacterized protein n=1 Tax=Nephila pilipes TaxID=299642 RepID=A0A8X6I9T5_NEPPI|nr:hypothetical protein NPIL_148181 [Nephila pilipes]
MTTFHWMPTHQAIVIPPPSHRPIPRIVCSRRRGARRLSTRRRRFELNSNEKRTTPLLFCVKGPREGQGKYFESYSFDRGEADEKNVFLQLYCCKICGIFVRS